MRQVAEKREGVRRGFRVFYPDVYVLDCPEDHQRQIKCLSCGRLTTICQAKRGPVTTPFGDIVAANIDEIYCCCGGHLGTIDNEGKYNEWQNPYVMLDEGAILVD